MLKKSAGRASPISQTIDWSVVQFNSHIEMRNFWTRVELD